MKVAGKERGVMGGRREMCADLCQLTYEQTLVASEVDGAFHIEDRDSWKQSFSPSLPLCPRLFVIYFTRALKGLKTGANLSSVRPKTIGLSCLPTEAGVPTVYDVCQ